MIRKSAKRFSERRSCRTKNLARDDDLAKSHRALVGHPPQDQRRVGAAESERIRQHDVDLALSRLVRHEIDRGLDRWIVEIDRWRGDVVANRQEAEDRL